MDDMPVMCRLDPGHHLDRDADSLLCRKLSFLLNIILQRDALDQFHDHIVKSPVLPHVVDIHHIGVHQPGSGLGFTDKLLDKHLVRTVVAF